MKKTRRRENQIIILIIIFIVFLIVRNIYITKFKYRTKLLDSQISYSVEIPIHPLIVRDEQVYFLDQILKEEEEDRIPVGKDLGNISKYRNDLGIDEVEVQNNYSLYLVKNEEELEEQEEIQKNEDLSEEKYQLLDLKESLLKGDLQEANLYIKDHYSKNSYNAEEKAIKELEFQIYDEMIQKVGMDLESLNAGIISHEIDGYETIYNYSNFYKLNSIIQSANSSIQLKPGFKIINNSKIGLHFNIPTEKLLNTYGLGKDIYFKIQEKEVPGKIIFMQVIGDETVFQVEIREAFDYFKDKRFAEIKLINYKTDAFQIPSKALVNKDGQEGVYLKNSANIVDFVPVEILDRKSKQTIINAGTEGEIINYNKRVETVGLYDEIILNPKLVEEGMLLD